MNATVLKVEKKINAKPERLFRAWITAKDFTRWFLSGTGIGLGEVVLDPRPGGKFRIDMIVDGILRPHEGEYHIVDEPKKLVFTWRSFMTQNSDTLVTVLFAAEGEGTRITLIHERIPGEMEFNAHRDGWTSILAGLDAYAPSL